MIVTVLAALFATPAHAARPITRAFTDDVWYDAVGSQWVPRTVAAGAGMVLLEVDWAHVEPTPAAAPTNPGDPAYSFAALDGVVRKFEGTGISVAFLVTDAPQWAEAPNGPSLFESHGAWEPNAGAYGQFATALARRYSGSYPDPLGGALPRVRYFQAWGEANFSIHLAPQWTRSGASLVPTGAAIYRNLLNAFYAGVKGVHSDNFVIATGLGPYGDPRGLCGNQEVGPGCRTSPALFLRSVLCLSGESLRAASCPNPAHFDAYAIDPYEVGSPSTHAFNVDDVSVPDLGKLTRVVNRAVPMRRALPRRNKQLWVTEFGYDSNPPNPGGASLATQGRWVDQALYTFWNEGVSTAVWYLVRDMTPAFVPGDYYTGVYYYDGTPKPSYEAYRFPFVVMPSGKSAVAWGISPSSGQLVVQGQRGRAWKTLFTVRASAGGTFVHRVSPRLHGAFRAVVRGESSLVWTR